MQTSQIDPSSIIDLSSLDSFINGCPENQVPVTARSLAYGDGVFESIRLKAGKPLRLELHLQRMSEGAHRLKLNFDQTRLQAELEQYLAYLAEQKVEEGALKVMLVRSGTAQGYGYGLPTTSDHVLIYRPVNHVHEKALQGVKVRLCDTRLQSNPTLAGIKHLNRLEQVLARSEWQDDSISEGIMLDADNHVIEGTMSNVFCYSRGLLMTPIINDTGVSGVMRRYVIEKLAPSRKINVVETHISEKLLIDSDEVFLTNALIGIWPVRAYENTRWERWPVTQSLQTLLDVEDLS